MILPIGREHEPAGERQQNSNNEDIEATVGSIANPSRTISIEGPGAPTARSPELGKGRRNMIICFVIMTNLLGVSAQISPIFLRVFS